MKIVYTTHHGNVTQLHRVHPALKHGVKRAFVQAASGLVGGVMGLCITMNSLYGASPREVFEVLCTKATSENAVSAPQPAQSVSHRPLYI